MSPSERRGQRRIKTAVEIAVSDARTGSNIGRVANLSVDGLMMLTKEPYEVGQRYSVLLNASAPTDKQALLPEMPLAVTLECVWVEPLAGSTWVGARFINCSSNDLVATAQLVAAFETGS